MRLAVWARQEGLAVRTGQVKLAAWAGQEGFAV